MFNKKKLFVLAVGAALVGLFTIAASKPCPRHYQLGGGWIGSGSGLEYSALYVPLDPSGQKAALRLQFVGWGADFAALMAAFGADAGTDGIGEAAMISPDTFKWTTVNYNIKQGNPPVKVLILVAEGTGKYSGLNRFDVNYDTSIYLAAADADGDGFPDAGATPLMTITNMTGSLKRVPVLH
jgi:hypothetical protein